MGSRKAEKKRVVGVAVGKELLEVICSEAERQGRTVSNMARLFLEAGVASLLSAEKAV